MELIGKVVLVTGGAQGIGKATCEAFLKRGCRICCSDVNEKKGNETMKEFQEKYGKDKALFLRCDVSVELEFEATYLKVKDIFGYVDILVNNAGVGGEKMLDVNLKGVIYGCKIAYKYMGKQNGGRGGAVVNTSSITALLPLPFSPEYAATKAGVVSLTRSYGCEIHYNLTGITFTAVCPSGINTELFWLTDENMPFLEEFDKIRKGLTLLEPCAVGEAIVRLVMEGQNGGVMTVMAGKENCYINFHEEDVIG